MISNPERVERLRDALRKADLDAFVCTLAVHVLMISGYSPVIGTSVAIVSRDGKISLLVPKDEEQFVSLSWADQIETYEPSSLKRLSSPNQSAVRPLRNVLKQHDLESGTIGYEHGPTSQPSTYSAIHIFGESILDLLRTAAPNVKLLPADRSLRRLASIKTTLEIDRIRIACAIAANAFDGVKGAILPGATEPEVAEALRRGFSIGPLTRKAQRTGGRAFCMAGEHSAKASGAFAQTAHVEIRERDLVLVHCNSFADGYWTDITRTYLCGFPGTRERRWYEAIHEARSAALNAIRPGARASDVDRAAREVLRARGFGDLFKHSTGHGVGFAAISANARPRLHPLSNDILEQGMVFNVEPAVYADGFGGLRHCDMVAVTRSGVEVLTPFQSRIEDMIVEIPGGVRAA